MELAQVEAHRRDESRGALVVHVADNPNDSFLLHEELEQQGLRVVLERASDLESLNGAVASGECAVVVVDLPTPEWLPLRVLDELGQTRPEICVLFRWGDAGHWSTEDSAVQVARTLREALALRPDRELDQTQRREQLRAFVRQQQAYHELARLDLWDFESSIRRITSALTRTLDAARASVWELSADERTLTCVDLFDARDQRHAVSADLKSFPRYLAALQSSVTLAASDARGDPRTSEFRAHYLEPLGIVSMLDTPVRRDGRVVAVVCVEHVGPSNRFWTVHEQCAATSIAQLVGRALEVRARRRYEERVAQLERMDSIGRVAHGVGHDLNNMLLVLLGQLELVVHSRAVETGALSHVQRAQDTAARMAELVRELLVVGRDELLELVELDLVAFVDRVVPLLRSAAGARATLEIDRGRAPIRARISDSALSRVMLNLVTNAIEASTEGGVVCVRLFTRREPANPERLRGVEFAVLSVEDRGRGIPPELLTRLFEPFVTTKSAAGLHGLGLATSYSLVQQMGGTIRVESALGRGSRFEVLLPLAASRG